MDGERNGFGREYYSKYGNLKYEGEFLNGKWNGKGKEYKFDKIIFQGNYLNGERMYYI